jgi:hypothetical protein
MPGFIFRRYCIRLFPQAHRVLRPSATHLNHEILGKKKVVSVSGSPYIEAKRRKFDHRENMKRKL